MKEYDVLVVGAGPAGSGAARASALAGVRTLMVDKKKEIGTPVQCGEVIGLELVKRSGMRIPENAIVARHQFTRFVLGREVVIDNAEAYWHAVTVERKIFDKHLAFRAARAGADVQADTKLLSVKMAGDTVKSCLLSHQGEEVELSPKAIVAADGVHSTLSKELKAEFFSPQDVARGVEFELVAKKDIPQCMQIFIEQEIGLGYGWIIPKGKRKANVGLGLVGVNASRRSFLEDWITGHPVVSRYFDVDKVLEVKIGDAPVPGFLGGPVRGNVLFCGDAAGQTLAFVGEGIMPSYICGSLAGKHAAMLSQGKGQRYEEELVESMADQLMMGAVLRDTLVELWSSDGLDGRMRSLLSGAVMNELVSPDDMMHSLNALEDDPLRAFKGLVKGSGRDIKVKRC
ncbi:MAG TPA: NAD(P)/FAD-dependent oxidoreductase [Methanomassiliicoccales archaeon]|nr:NAD(P)/FAD-dependent oxidoreductase [Methanomassiliicoccales archaeon]